MCRVFSCVVGRGCLLWPVCSLGKTLLAFALLHSVLHKAKFTCYSRCFLTSYSWIPVPYNEKDIFWGVNSPPLFSICDFLVHVFSLGYTKANFIALNTIYIPWMSNFKSLIWKSPLHFRLSEVNISTWIIDIGKQFISKIEFLISAPSPTCSHPHLNKWEFYPHIFLCQISTKPSLSHTSFT